MSDDGRITHRRLSFAGVCAAALATGKGPVELLVRHLADPLHQTVLQTMGVAT
jgi:hypothetical protein